MHHYIQTLLRRKKRIYLDYAATTPVAQEVFSAMKPYFNEQFGNPSAIYAEGVDAKRVIEQARRDVADVLKVRRTDVIFTGGGTESNHLAIRGLIERLHAEGRAFTDMEIVSTRMEHPSVTELLSVLGDQGVVVKHAAPNEDGLIEEQMLVRELSPRTVLVTFAYANSEIGVVQEVKQITRTVRKYAAEQNTTIKVHLDASQAPLWLPCQMDMLGVDLMTLDAGKCYGPKGVGVLAYRHGVSLRALVQGGGQESGLRAGTENVPLIVGCATALVRAQKKWEERSARVAALRELFFNELTTRIEGVVVNGSRDARVANNVNISISGIDTEFAVVVLDTNGVAASTKSACSSASGTGSKVVLEISHDAQRANSTLRFSLGEATTKHELEYTLHVLKTHVDTMRTFQKTQKTPV